MVLNPQQTLQRYFGYDNFRPGQIEIINSILNKHDTLAILATGGGKSICFQIPGLMMSGSTIVISPLISLMKDQVETLQSKNIKATFINSSLSVNKIKKRYQQIKAGQYKFIYLAPERLKNIQFIKLCQKINICLIAIDEAHCISMWGHDFRPNYQKIPLFIKQLKKRPVLAAFTATATFFTQKDIINSLQLNKPKIFLNSFKRDNLSINIIKIKNKTDKLIKLLTILQKHRGKAGIIYTSTRKEAKNISQIINKLFHKKQIDFYHGAMTTEQRNQIQDNFLANKISIIAATNAFGMGVDKSNIRFVIHYQIPGNIENYYQEIGRAGRDRKLADSYLLFDQNDIKIQLGFIKMHSKRTKFNLEKLKSMLNYIYLPICHHYKILDYFGELNLKHQCKLCNFCKKNNLEMSKNSLKLKKELFRIRNLLAFNHNIPPQQILTNKLVELLILLKPQTQQQFLSIPGIGKGWLKQWYNILSGYIN